MAKKVSTEKINTINIKSEPVQAHIGSSKYTNNDWGTIAFLIDRREIQHNFADKELRYNCIYFLIGYDGSTEMLYVGQAKKRNNGESVLARLREHDNSTTEEYRDIWDWVIAVTNKDDSWTLDDLNALEHAFYAEIPLNQNLNGNTPNSGGADYNFYTDKIKQIKSYVTAIGFEIFKDTVDTENMQVTSVINEYSTVEDLQNGMARIPEIVTPDKVVKEMVDMLPSEVWNSKTVFLDPACKGGEYLREVYDRLMDCELLQSEFPNQIERSNHILQNQLYGIALSQVSLDRTAKKLLGFSVNLRIIPNYIDKLRGINLGSRPDGSQNNMLDILNKEFGKEMKIDVVIGNPPYQKINANLVEGSVAAGESIYQYFVEMGGKIADIVCMITPAKWFAGNKKLDSLRTLLLKGNHMTSVTILDAGKTFHIIMDKVAYFCWDKKYIGKTIIIDKTCIDNNDERYLENDNIDCFIPSKFDNSIVEKVRGITEKSLEQYIQSQNCFGLITSTRGYEDKVNEDDIVMHFTGYKNQGDNVCYIPREWVGKNKSLIDQYKVLYPHGCGSKGNVLTRVIYAGKGEVCTQSYVVIGPISAEKYARNIEKYIRTKFVRVLVRVRMIDQHLDKDRFRFVPFQDFTDQSDIDWSQPISNIDQQLYKKYNLTQEEIDYIEKTIKPME